MTDTEHSITFSKNEEKDAKQPLVRDESLQFIIENIREHYFLSLFISLLMDYGYNTNGILTFKLHYSTITVAKSLQNGEKKRQ